MKIPTTLLKNIWRMLNKWSAVSGECFTSFNKCFPQTFNQFKGTNKNRHLCGDRLKVKTSNEIVGFAA